MAAVGIALAALAGLAAVSTLSAPHVPSGAPSVPRVAAVPTTAIGPTPRGGGAPPPAIDVAEGSELHVRETTGDIDGLDVAGRVPDGFRWAAVDLLVGGIPIASAARLAGADGTFTATMLVPGLYSVRDAILVRLRGLRDGELTAVVLREVTVGATRMATWPLDRRTVIPR